MIPEINVVSRGERRGQSVLERKKLIRGDTNSTKQSCRYGGTRICIERECACGRTSALCIHATSKYVLKIVIRLASAFVPL